MKCSRTHNKYNAVCLCVCVCVCFGGEVGTGRRDELPVLPVFVSQSLITSALCASPRSHVTIFEQLQTIVVCLLFSIDTERAEIWFDKVECVNLER